MGGFWNRGIVCFAVGALIGLLIAFFSTYFAVVFLSIGASILYRLHGREQNESGDIIGVVTGGNLHPKPTELRTCASTDDVTPTQLWDARRKRHLRVFSYLSLVTGAVCLLLEGEWYFYFPRIVKIPIYALLGVSVSLALVFSVIDAINFVVGLCQGNTMARPIVESPNQIHLLLCLGAFLGAIFGFIFGNFQVADVDVYKLQISLLRSEFRCYEIGGFLGGLGGVANEYLRHIEFQYSPVGLHFDEDI